MPVSHVTPAIVLRSWPFGESDKIVSFLTEGHGKITGIAKGAKRSKKRFANSLEPFSFVTLRFQDSAANGLAFILGCELQRSFRNLIGSLEKIAFASYGVEITGGLIGERDENRLVFDHLKNYLNQLEDHQASLLLLTVFELKLLSLAGYRPLLDTCLCCGRHRRRKVEPFSSPLLDWYFSFRDGGVLCGACSRIGKDILPINDETLELMATLQREHDWKAATTPPPAHLKQLRSVVLRFIEFQANKPMKSSSFLYRFSSSPGNRDER